MRRAQHEDKGPEGVDVLGMKASARIGLRVGIGQVESHNVVF